MIRNRRSWPRHRAFVATFPCRVAGCPYKAECCHLRTAANSGMGLKPHDAFTAPLCHKHHLEQEGRTNSFSEKYGVDLWAIAAALVVLSPDAAMKESMKGYGS